MVMHMCSIYDGKAEAWLQPMVFQGRGQAVRSFADAVNDEQSEFGKHPEDYTLFEIGEFDQRSGLLSPLDAPEALALGVNVKESEVLP